MADRKTHQIFKPDFLLIPYQLIEDRTLEPTDRLLYALVYWYEHLRDGSCTASNNSMAAILHTTTRAVQNSLNALEERGYIEREYKDEARRNRSLIKSKIAFKIERTAGDRAKSSEPAVTRERTSGDRHERTVGDQSNNKKSSNTSENTSRAKGAEREPITGESPMEAQIGEIIFRFQDYNPAYKTLFSRKPQRDAAQRLLEQFGFDRLCGMISYLRISNAARYAPTITTPVQLESKLGELKAWADKQRSADGMRGKKIISAATA